MPRAPLNNSTIALLHLSALALCTLVLSLLTVTTVAIVRHLH